MNYVGHLIVGLILTSIVAYFLYPSHIGSIPMLLIFLTIGTASALVPDLDHPKSKGTKILNTTMFILLILFATNLSFGLGSSANPFISISIDSIVKFLFLSILFCLAWIGLITIIRPRHRGITHSFLALGIYSLILYFVFGPVFLVPGAVGYFSHLLADKTFKVV